ncbi:hypothetical protein AAY473_019693 [Plecturocebus cupreus]
MSPPSDWELLESETMSPPTDWELPEAQTMSPPSDWELLESGTMSPPSDWESTSLPCTRTNATFLNLNLAQGPMLPS